MRISSKLIGFYDASGEWVEKNVPSPRERIEFPPSYNPLPESIEDIHTIPEELVNDQIFKTVCPITRMPIRNPVADINNPDHVYEEGAILRWLKIKQKSPLTQHKLTAKDLVADRDLKRKIDEKLSDWLAEKKKNKSRE